MSSDRPKQPDLRIPIGAQNPLEQPTHQTTSDQRLASRTKFLKTVPSASGPGLDIIPHALALGPSTDATLSKQPRLPYGPSGSMSPFDNPPRRPDLPQQ